MQEPILFAWLPYAAAALLVLVPAWRCRALLGAARQPAARPPASRPVGGHAAAPAAGFGGADRAGAAATATAGAAVASDAWAAWRGSRAWRLGLAILLGGHLLALALPAQLLLWNRVAARLLVLEAVGFAGGLLALGGLVHLLRGRLRRLGGGAADAPSWPSLADTLLLTLVALAMGSGLAVAVVYRWGSSWSAAVLAPYLRSLLELHPDVGVLGGLPPLVRLHVLSGICALAVAPFTELGYLPLRVLAPLAAALAASRRRRAPALGRSVAN